jgi:hypothetical protein
VFRMLVILVMIHTRYRYSNHDSISSSTGLKQVHTKIQVLLSIHAMIQLHIYDEQMNLVGHSMVKKKDSVGHETTYHSSSLLLVRTGLKPRKTRVIISRLISEIH